MTKRKHILILLPALFFNCFLCTVSFAQETTVSINAQVDRSQVLLGEQIKLKIELTTPAAQPLTQWFNFPDSFNHLEVVERNPVDSSLQGSIKKYAQQFTITGFDSGVWDIPAFPVTIANKTYNTQTLTITVVPVRLQDSTYHDIREIIDVPQEKTPWWYWIAGILSLILFGVLVWLWLRARKKSPAAATVNNAAKLSAFQEAMEKLRQLQREELPAKGEWKKFYSALTEILKVYSQKRFTLPALQYTTDELLVHLGGISRETTGRLAESLRIADAVKFAKYEPAVDQAATDIKNIEIALQELDRLKQ